jgi:tRNA pseudouridine55 synthase
MYSALHYQGQRLYTLARAGIEIERPARPITVHRLEIVAWRPPRLTLHITCSSGTYVRSLIHDLGRALGCGAILMELVRQQTGPFRIEGAHTLERLEEAFAAGGAIELLLPMDYPMATWPAVRLDSAGEAAARMGQAIPAASILAVTSGEAMEDLFWPPPASGLARAYDACGRFIGVVAWQVAGGTWRTRKLLA